MGGKMKGILVLAMLLGAALLFVMPALLGTPLGAREKAWVVPEPEKLGRILPTESNALIHGQEQSKPAFFERAPKSINPPADEVKRLQKEGAILY